MNPGGHFRPGAPDFKDSRVLNRRRDKITEPKSVGDMPPGLDKAVLKSSRESHACSELCTFEPVFN